MRLPRGTREAVLAAIAAGIVVLLFTALDRATLPRALETASLDLRFRLRGARPPGPDVVLVMVDDRSLAAIGRWPFSRRVFAKALQTLDQAGARLIVFDLLFAEPEQSVPVELRAVADAAAGALADPQDTRLRAALRQIADDDPDGAFEAALRTAKRVLLPVAFGFRGPAESAPDYLADSAYARFDKSPVAPAFTLHPVSAGLPIERFATAAAGLGSVNIAFDLDGAPRYDYLAWPFEADFVPSMPLRAAAEYLGVPWSDVALVLGSGVRVGDRFVPTDPAMRLLVNYRGPAGTFKTFSFVDLVEGRVPADALRGKLVLVGASVLGLSDSNPAPFGSTPMPGTERMANMIDTILRGDFIRELSGAGMLGALAVVLLLALAGGAATALLPSRIATLAALLVPVGWLAAAQAAFQRGLWLPVVPPVAALVAATATVLLFRYWVVDREGRRVRTAFRHYLAPALVNDLAAHPERLRLGGETRRMTMLFCDIRGFTTISEQYKTDPHGLTRLINRFLTPMTDLILARRGTIDKYMGDCIMAFWNAPLDDTDHADHACDSALAMLRGLDALNMELRDEAAAAGRPFHALHIGVGVNSGDCVVGNMGSDQRFDYSVLGDAVNLASRLEGLTKAYGVDIVIGETTRTAAPSWATLEIDLVAVKGKREAARIYALLGDYVLAESAEFAALAAAHASMLERYRARDWSGACAALTECRPLDSRLATLYDLYAARIAHFMEHPPGDDWDGVFVATTK